VHAVTIALFVVVAVGEASLEGSSSGVPAG
jgi:hypothetical protein